MQTVEVRHSEQTRFSVEKADTNQQISITHILVLEVLVDLAEGVQ